MMLVRFEIKAFIARCLVVMACIGMFAGEVSAQKGLSEDRNVVLVIASYNPDTKRMSSFLAELDGVVTGENLMLDIRVEDMGCRGISESYLWKNRMKSILAKYDMDEVSAVVLLGQEAWSTYLSLSAVPKDVPFFGCFVSENGILIPDYDVSKLPELWAPESVNMLERARELGMAGGIVNRYGVAENVKLIQNLYPETENIAFVSDNTYGGISIQALVKKELEAIKDITPIYIDARYNQTQLDSIFASMPEKTVILIGTWRVNSSNHYYMSCSFEKELAKSPRPVFTLTGSELGATAVGGHVPEYTIDAKFITKQIKDYYVQKLPPYFKLSKSQYLFDSKKMAEAGISKSKLPTRSVVVDNLEDRLRQYKLYIQTGVATLVVLITLLLFVFYYFFKNKRLATSLQDRELELIQAKNKAEESDRLKSAFLANMSHEIRTPLNSIVGFSMLLREQDIDEHDREQYCSIIARNSDMLLALINDILDMSKLDANKIMFDYKSEDIVSLCREIIATTSYSRPTDVTCRFECDCDELIINTDSKRLSQVMINLLVNAGKFTKQGSITLSLKDDVRKDQLIFAVTDTGSGIPLDKQLKVFDRFEKINDFDQGTGLGLSICRQIVVKFGGRIWIDPEYRSGARFVFTIQKNTQQKD